MAEDLKPIPIERALGIARKGILEHNPFLEDRTKEYSRLGKAGDTILVERIDRVELESYYLISWTVEELTVAIVQVNAITGSFLGVSTLANPAKSPFLSIEEARKKAALANNRRNYGVPRYIWQPCRESTNPTNPFCEVPYDNGVVYVTMTGEVLSELTPLGRGG